MAFLLKIAFYASFAVVSLIGAFYGASYLFYRGPADANRSLHSWIFFTVALIAFGTLLYWAFRLGHQQERWGSGLGLVVAAVAAVAVIFLIAMFTYKGPVNWQ
jgi:hypothetical protein